MIFQAEINIMPHKELLDPQGKAVQHSLGAIHVVGVQDVRIGKHISLRVEADDETAARAQVEAACKQLLANLIMETYSYELIAQN
jgi:phosphoribosylformylglycinamidine synthase PurS subunit